MKWTRKKIVTAALAGGMFLGGGAAAVAGAVHAAPAKATHSSAMVYDGHHG